MAVDVRATPPTPMSSSVLRRLSTTTHHLSRSASSSASAMAYQTRVIGAPNTLQHRVFIVRVPAAVGRSRNLAETAAPFPSFRRRRTARS